MSVEDHTTKHYAKLKKKRREVVGKFLNDKEAFLAQKKRLKKQEMRYFREMLGSENRYLQNKIILFRQLMRENRRVMVKVAECLDKNDYEGFLRVLERT